MTDMTVNLNLNINGEPPAKKTYREGRVGLVHPDTGEWFSLADIADMLGLDDATSVSWRIREGWSARRIFETPNLKPNTKKPQAIETPEPTAAPTVEREMTAAEIRAEIKRLEDKLRARFMHVQEAETLLDDEVYKIVENLKNHPTWGEFITEAFSKGHPNLVFTNADGIYVSLTDLLYEG